MVLAEKNEKLQPGLTQRIVTELANIFKMNKAQMQCWILMRRVYCLITDNEESMKKVVEELKKIKNDDFTPEERAKFKREGDNTKSLMHEFVRVVIENDLVEQKLREIELKYPMLLGENT